MLMGTREAEGRGLKVKPAGGVIVGRGFAWKGIVWRGVVESREDDGFGLVVFVVLVERGVLVVWIVVVAILVRRRASVGTTVPVVALVEGMVAMVVVRLLWLESC